MSSSEHLRASAKQLREAANDKRRLLDDLSLRIESLKKQQAELESIHRQTTAEIAKLNSQAHMIETEAQQAAATERQL